MVQQKKSQGKRKKRNVGLDLGIAATLVLLLCRIPLANIIGDKGNGYLAVSWELFVLFSLVFGYGFSQTVSQMVRTRVGKNQYRNSSRVLGTAFLAGVLSSVAGAAIMYLVSRGLVNVLLKLQLPDISVYVKLAGISVQLYAVMLIINTVIGIFRGYFEGTGSRVPTRISRLIQAVVTATGALIFASMLKNHGEKVGNLLFNEQYEPAFAAAGVVSGCICGGLLSGLFLLVVYILYRTSFQKLIQKDTAKLPENRGGILKSMYKGIAVLIAEVIFFLLYRMVNLFFYAKTYVQGENALNGIEYAGVYYGKITLLVSIVVVLTLAFTDRNKKRIRHHFSQNSYRNGKQLLGDDLEKIFSFGLPAMGSFLILTQAFMQALFQSCTQTDAIMLRVASVAMVFIALGVYLYRMMIDLGMRKPVLVIQAVAFVVQTVVMAFTVKITSLGAVSLVVAELIFWVILACGELAVMMKSYKIRFSWYRLFIAPAIRTVVLVLVELLFVLLFKNTWKPWILCIVSLGIGTVFYQLTRKLPFLKME